MKIEDKIREGQVLLDQRENYESSATDLSENQLPPNRRPVSSVGRAPDCCAGGRRIKPGPDQHSGSLNNWGERAAFVMTPANG